MMVCFFNVAFPADTPREDCCPFLRVKRLHRTP